MIQPIEEHDFSQTTRNSSPRLTYWSTEEGSAFGLRPVIAHHRLHDLDLFSDGELISLLEKHPRDLLQAFTMGCNPATAGDWKAVDTKGASGEDLFKAVSQGRLWFNILGIHLVDSRYRELVESLYDELSRECQNFKVLRKKTTLIVSSPSAIVYYHADAQPNLLWQIRGNKRVWVYPPEDRSLISQELMEDIFASHADEEAPYKPEFDDKAVIFDLNPGRVIAWPLNAPHRVANLDQLNVSLSTIHETPESDRRKMIFCANRLLRRVYHLPAHSTEEIGFVPSAKRLAFRACSGLGLVKTPPRRAYVTDLRIDLSFPAGIRRLDTPVLTEFSKKDFTINVDGAGRVVVVPKTQRA
jgi:Cupin-like domain